MANRRLMISSTEGTGGIAPIIDRIGFCSCLSFFVIFAKT
jgi:hypothetical protein